VGCDAGDPSADEIGAVSIEFPREVARECGAPSMSVMAAATILTSCDRALELHSRVIPKPGVTHGRPAGRFGGWTCEGEQTDELEGVTFRDCERGDQRVRLMEAYFCPTLSTRQLSEGETAFDSRELVGLPLSTAKRRAKENSCEIRITRENGENYSITLALIPNRINIAVRGERVTRVFGIG
jgi:hypothetical protein